MGGLFVNAAQLRAITRICEADQAAADFGETARVRVRHAFRYLEVARLDGELRVDEHGVIWDYDERENRMRASREFPAEVASAVGEDDL